MILIFIMMVIDLLLKNSVLHELRSKVQKKLYI